MHRDMVHYCFFKETMTNPLTCKQNQKKQITNVENCEKTPTLSSLSTIFIRLQNGAKKKSPYCPPFGDVIINETGTRLKRGVTGSDRNHSKDQTVFHRQRSSREERRTDTDKEPDWQRREIRPNDSE